MEIYKIKIKKISDPLSVVRMGLHGAETQEYSLIIITSTLRKSVGPFLPILVSIKYSLSFGGRCRVGSKINSTRS
jgi:hypothetical protein